MVKSLGGSCSTLKWLCTSTFWVGKQIRTVQMTATAWCQTKGAWFHMAKQIADQLPSDTGPTPQESACGTDTRRLHQTAQEAATYLFPKERGRLLLNALLQ